MNIKRKRTVRSHEKGAKTAILASSLSYIVLGIIMLIFPDEVSNFLCYAMGIVLTIYGLFNILNFFLSRELELYPELIVGIAATAFGVFTIASPQTIKSIIFIAIGVIIIIDSCMDIKNSIRLKAFGMKRWWVYFILSIAIIILSIITIIFNSFFGNFLIVILGLMMIYEGISGLTIAVLISHFIKQMDKSSNMIETSADDIDN